MTGQPGYGGGGPQPRVGDIVTWHNAAGQLTGTVVKVGALRLGSVELTIKVTPEHNPAWTARQPVSRCSLVSRGKAAGS